MQWDALDGPAFERGHTIAPGLCVFASLMLLGSAPGLAHADWILGAGAGVRYDDNVGNAQSRADITGDTSLNARLSAFRLFPLDAGYSVSLGGELGGELYDTLTGLNTRTSRAYSP